jgi:hypothetical protein
VKIGGIYIAPATMPQTNLPQTSNAEQQRSNISTESAQSEQQKKKKRRKRKSKSSKKGAHQQQMQPPSDVGRGNNNEIEGGTNTGDTEMNEVETSSQQNHSE